MKLWLSTLACGLMMFNFAHADQKTLENNLKKQFPGLPAKILGTTPIPNMYEIQVGDNIIYTDENARYFFVGSLVDFKNKENLTAKTEKQLNKIDVSILPLDQAIKYVKGNGERVLYVFSDPDCPYCKKLEENMTSIDNVTVYLFLYPLKNLHANAETIAKQIWCSSNRYEAWEDYMILKEAPSASPTCSNPVAKNIALGNSLNISGTPTLFLADGTRIAGTPTTEHLKSILDTIK